MAASLGVSTSDVNITLVTDIAVAGRRLRQAGGVVVDFTVAAASSSIATALQSDVTALQEDPSVFTSSLNTALVSAGVSVQCTVAVSAPVVQAAAVNTPTVDVSAIQNISTSQSLLSTSLSGATDSAALSALQTSYLGARSTASSTAASAGDVSNLAALVSSVVAASNGTALTSTVQTAALSALASLSTSNVTVSGSTGESMLATMSAVIGGSTTAGMPTAKLSADALDDAATVMLSVATAVNLTATTTDAVLDVMSRATAAAPSVNISSATSTTLLRTMTVVTNATTAPLSSSSTDAAAAVMVAVSRSVTFTPAATTAVLSVLSVVASGNVNASGGAGGNIVNALSSVASSATSAGGAVTVRAVSGVLDTLATSQVASLLATMSATSAPVPPAVSVSPTIQTFIQVDPPGGTRLSTAPLVVNGSASAFAPMPAGLFAGVSSGVVTEFRSTAFDPYEHDNGTTSGVTRLAFNTSSGGAIVVANAAVPVLFTLPAPDTSAGGLQARCQFWSPALGAYDTRGCAGVPSPAPPNHTLAFVAGYTTPDDAVLALSWSISGELVTPDCRVAVLDCSRTNPLAYDGVNWTNPGDALLPRRVFPDPGRPLSVPAVACPPLAGQTDATGAPLCVLDGKHGACPLLRVYAGAACPLWQPNAANCSWDNIKQSFVGGGCVAGSGPQQCMCRHLTDFAAARAPQIPTCSLSDLTSFSAADIVTKLRTLFIIVITLFGIMNLGAGVGYVLDARERRAVVTRLQQPDTGFECGFQGDADCWTWSFRLDDLSADVGSPGGSAVAISAVLGVPFARLRAALPDELARAPLGSALGRRQALSLAGLAAARALQDELVGTISGRTARLDKKRLHTPSEEAAPMPPTPPSDQADGVADADAAAAMERFLGTALVLAFLQLAALLPVVELARRKGAAARRFSGITTPFGWDFAKTQTDFVTLLTPGVLTGRHRWLQRARLWRLILSQNTDGSWIPSTTAAFALEARHSAELAELPPTLLGRVTDCVRGATEEDGDGDGGGGGGGDMLDAALNEAMLAGAEQTPRAPAAADEAAAAAVTAEELAASATDCPLTFQVSALLGAMPARLAKLRAADATVDVARVWTTLCCVEVLSRMNASWVWGDGDIYEEHERTIVDAGREWVQRYADEEKPALKAALADGGMERAAQRATMRWHRACEQRIAEVRCSEAITSHMTLSHLHRSATNVLRALITQHSTFATFLSEPLDGLQRWQMFVILISLVIAQLLVNIWMFYAKGVNCCAAARLLLDSGPDGGSCPPVGACRGFEGTCGQLAAQFAEVPVLPDFPNGLADWTCTAFPDDNNPVDSFIVGLISIAICIPVTIFIASCFGIANDSEAPESWLEWTSGWRKLVFGLNAHRRWHWTRGAPPVRHVRWYCRSIGAPPPETVANLWHSLVAWLTCTEPPWLIEAREAAAEEADAAERAAAEARGEKPAAAPADDDQAAGSEGGSMSSSIRSAMELQAYKRTVMVYGLLGTAVSWTLFVWFIFTYGMLVHQLLGDDAESSFARSWGISYGLNAATEWKDIATEAAKAAVILFILERLFLTRNASWLEEHIDYLSLQALLFRRGSLSVLQQTRLFFEHTKRLSD